MKTMVKFIVGDKVKVEDFFGRVIHITEVTEITQAGNVRVKAYKGLFNPDGKERRRHLFWADRIYIRKLQTREETVSG